MVISKKERNCFFDNLKGLIIILVVMFHLIPTGQNFIFDSLYGFVFTFHMPFFILISGYFTRNNEKQARKAFSLLLLYYILSLLFYIFKNQELYLSISNIKNIKLNYEFFIQPFISHYYVSWYLCVIFLYRVFCSSIANIKHFVIVSFIIGIVGSLLRIDYYMIRRALVLLPFFSIGYYLSKFKLEDIKKYFISKKLAIPFLILSFFLFIIAFYFALKMNKNFSVSCIPFGEKILLDIFSRKRTIILFLIMSYIFSLGVIYLISTVVTEKKCFFTLPGKNSLCIYFFHAFFTLFIRKHILIPLLEIGGNDMIFSVLFIAVVMTGLIVLIFSRDIVTKYTIAPLERLSQKILIRKD
ncbi:acyltransferase family protein [uncultured Anaerofustis sp.]|uniref:acyltransferase family protein n=1 Tax=uncultured Anaerofustis sp. TaxID=904996 RepID=UPI0025F1183B|nr:acyltransferase family protein [uncultured Anaerofustis sp.]